MFFFKNHDENAHFHANDCSLPKTSTFLYLWNFSGNFAVHCSKTPPIKCLFTFQPGNSDKVKNSFSDNETSGTEDNHSCCLRFLVISVSAASPRRLVVHQAVIIVSDSIFFFFICNEVQFMFCVSIGRYAHGGRFSGLVGWTVVRVSFFRKKKSFEVHLRWTN